jgi:succinate dehydrogenase flavin-adding protein (antitoxin of CptAB toxin-antitoxin module)
MEILRGSARVGRGKWVITYPDLHTDIDGLAAIRGPQQLLMDLIERPEAIQRAMRDMTELLKWIVDEVSAVVLPAGQGTTNWTMGWSRERFLCIGQNDATCMISPETFNAFCLTDTVAGCRYVEHTIYHLDGPGALRHLPRLLEIEELDCVQWIQGAGNPPPSQWLSMLKLVQEAGKSVQVYYGPSHSDDADLEDELAALCRELDWRRLFFWAVVPSVQRADALVELACHTERRDAH